MVKMVVTVESSCIVCKVKCFDRHIGRLTTPFYRPLTHGLVRILVAWSDIRGRRKGVVGIGRPWAAEAGGWRR